MYREAFSFREYREYHYPKAHEAERLLYIIGARLTVGQYEEARKDLRDNRDVLGLANEDIIGDPHVWYNLAMHRALPFERTLQMREEYDDSLKFGILNSLEREEDFKYERDRLTKLQEMGIVPSSARTKYRAVPQRPHYEMRAEMKRRKLETEDVDVLN